MMAMTGLLHGQRVAYRGEVVTIWSQADKSRHWWIADQSDHGLTNFRSASQHWFYPPTDEGVAKSIEYATKKDAEAVTA